MLTSCKTASLPSETPDVSFKFGTKLKTLHEPIIIDRPGIYDFEGTTHIWRGEGDCDFLSPKPAVMEIHADNVTVKNFGFTGSVLGIRIVSEGTEVRRNVRLVNVEGDACLRPISLPDNAVGLELRDVSFARFSREVE